MLASHLPHLLTVLATDLLQMLAMGVPKQALRGKIAGDGLDPAVIDMDPEGPAPEGGGDGGGGGGGGGGDSSGSESDSGSDSD